QDRKVLRKFWSQSKLHLEEASFHVVITSYQLIVTDVKYFQRIKWHYMILDEAQAIKSSTRFGFNTPEKITSVLPMFSFSVTRQYLPCFVVLYVPTFIFHFIKSRVQHQFHLAKGYQRALDSNLALIVLQSKI